MRKSVKETTAHRTMSKSGRRPVEYLRTRKVSPRLNRVRLSFSVMVLVCVAIFAAAAPRPLRAQTPSTDWSTPINLSSKGESVGARVKAATDVVGNVHVVWGDWVGNGAQKDQSNTLFYSWWNGVSWSRPIDILTSLDPAQMALVSSLTTTQDGRIVVTWSSDRGLCVSQAEIGKATNARNWTTIQVSPNRAGSARLQIDPTRKRWHLAYTQQFRSVLLVSSDESGGRWGPAREIWAASDTNSATALVDMAIAEDGSANIVWSENTAEHSWMGGAIWRARIAPDQNVAPVVQQVTRSDARGPTMDWPVIVADAKRLALFWNNGVGSKTGRFFQWSQDNGKTWSAIQPVFPNDLSGQTSEAGLTFDGNGVLHLVTAALGNDGKDGVLRYANWTNGIWSNYTNVWPDYFGERITLLVTGGNRLHLVWLDRAHKTVAYSSRLIDAPATPKQSFVARQAPTAAPPTQSSAPKTLPASVPTAMTTVPSFADTQGSATATSPVEALLPGVLPVFALCLVVILNRLRSARPRS